MNTAAEKIPATGPQRRSFLLCILFLLCALLWNPEIYYIWQQKFTYLPFFTTGALVFLALGIIVQGPEFQPLRKFMLIAGIAFCLMFLGQILTHASSLTLARIGEALWWIVIPALAYTHYQSFRKLLPVYVLVLGSYDFLYFVVGNLRIAWSPGITGNINWTAALVIMTMIFLGWHIRERFTRSQSAKQRKKIFGFGIAGELLLGCQLWKIGSKGAFLAAGATALLFIFLRSSAKIRKILIGLVLLGLLAGSFWAVKHTDSISRFINDDGRVIFWENAAALIADHPLFGVGQGSFENEYMRYRKADYFFILNPASRSNHPHNHLLFMAGSWGLIGLVLWGILLFAPLAVMIRKYYRHETVDPLETACFLTLCYAFLHGSLDIIMFTMPTGLIALLCLGMLWRNLSDPKKTPVKIPGHAVKPAAAAAMMILAGLVVRTGCFADLQVRRAYRNELTADEIVRTARACPGEYQSNFALLNYLLKRGESAAVVAVTDVMLKSHTPNYPGVHMGRGNALMRLGRFGEALENYRVEAELFPLTLRPVYNMIVAARAIKDPALAAKLKTELRERMRIRGCDDRALKIILTGKLGAHYDLRVRDIPEE